MPKVVETALAVSANQPTLHPGRSTRPRGCLQRELDEALVAHRGDREWLPDHEEPADANQIKERRKREKNSGHCTRLSLHSGHAPTPALRGRSMAIATAQHETRPIPISRLILDQENARHGKRPDQEAVIEWMATHQDRSYLLRLAQSIASRGLNPADRCLVVPAEDDASFYVIMEGNRRVSALKLLANPDLCPNQTLAKQLRAIAQEAIVPLPTAVDCVIMPDPQTAAQWIELRHIGLQGGAGVAPWGSHEQEAFRTRFGLPPKYGPSLEILNFAERQGLLVPADRKRVPISSLQRLLGTPEVRQRMGLDMRRGHIVFTGDIAHIERAVSDVLGELVASISVSKIKSVDQRRAWIGALSERKGWQSGLPEPSLARAIPLFPRDDEQEPSEDQEQLPQVEVSQPVRRAPRDPLQRKTVIAPGTGLRTNSPKLKQVFLELRRLEVDEFPIAGAVLLRVFIEILLDTYLQTHSMRPRDKLAGKANQVRDHVLKQNPQMQKEVKRDFKGLDIFANRPDSTGSANTLHAVVHGLSFQLSPADVKRDWDQLRPCITWLEGSL